MALALSVVKNVTKVSIAGGFLYWSVQQGIWGTADQGAEAGRRIAKVIAPATAEYIEKIPPVPDFGNSFTKNWNSGMSAIFSTMANIPDNVQELTTTLTSYIENATATNPTSEKKSEKEE
ncbi:uncharacterized protein LOC131950181 [Physella acuta]|uniref:uncharacterized protein LOC131950181 n=1 Tax=Physella acuta TaxID=109671 RepID=UPI0027DDD7D5|nr:uncharacterized protein LOC131950181 [Physella acuta]XP_059168217.1 uncharacterized protein LOC131950181 [Physella acuta]XP_059168218.1 uncharacterized protein LOC131950181 [Physella acuta]